jgi:hypothetical protein
MMPGSSGMVMGIRRDVQLARDDGRHGHADQQHGKNLADAPWTDGLHNTPTEGSSQYPVPPENCRGGTTGKVSVKVYCRHCHHVKLHVLAYRSSVAERYNSFTQTVAV